MLFNRFVRLFCYALVLSQALTSLSAIDYIIKLSVGKSQIGLYNTNEGYWNKPFGSDQAFVGSFGIKRAFAFLPEKFEVGVDFGYQRLYSDESATYSLQLITFPLFIDCRVYSLKSFHFNLKFNLGSGVGLGENLITKEAIGNPLFVTGLTQRVAYTFYDPNYFWVALDQLAFFEFSNAGVSNNILYNFRVRIGFTNIWRPKATSLKIGRH